MWMSHDYFWLDEKVEQDFFWKPKQMRIIFNTQVKTTHQFTESGYIITNNYLWVVWQNRGTLYRTCSAFFAPSLYPVVPLHAGQWHWLPRPFIIRGGGSSCVGGIPWRSLHTSRWGLKFGTVTGFVHCALPAVFWVGAAEAWLQTFVCEVADLKGGSMVGSGELRGEDGTLQWPHRHLYQ